MTKDDICWDREEENYDDHDRFVSEENQQYYEDCNERADDMREEVRSVW
jgi:hypothetical protein